MINLKDIGYLYNSPFDALMVAIIIKIILINAKTPKAIRTNIKPPVENRSSKILSGLFESCKLMDLKMVETTNTIEATPSIILYKRKLKLKFTASFP